MRRRISIGLHGKKYKGIIELKGNAAVTSNQADKDIIPLVAKLICSPGFLGYLRNYANFLCYLEWTNIDLLHKHDKDKHLLFMRKDKSTEQKIRCIESEF